MAESIPAMSPRRSKIAVDEIDLTISVSPPRLRCILPGLPIADHSGRCNCSLDLSYHARTVRGLIPVNVGDADLCCGRNRCRDAVADTGIPDTDRRRDERE